MSAMVKATRVALQSDTAEGNQNCDRPAKSRLVSKLLLRMNLCWCSFAVQFHLARLHWVCRFSLADTLLDFKFPEGWPDLSINALLLDVVPSREAIPTLCQSRLLGCRGKRKSLRYSLPATAAVSIQAVCPEFDSRVCTSNWIAWLSR